MTRTKKTLGEKAVKLVIDLCIIMQSVMIVGLNTRRYSRMKKSICSGLTTAMVAGVGTSAAHSWVGTGCLYFFASIEKRLGIFWATDGDWGHWLSGGRYTFFKGVKESLIDSDNFAKLLNWLAGGGPLGKVLEISLLTICLLVSIFLFLALCQAVWNLVGAIMRPTKVTNPSY